MYEYLHGGDIYSARRMTGGQEIIDFSSNINPAGLSDRALDAISHAARLCSRYPDPFCRDLTSAISEYEKVDKSWIFCSNGASEIIFRLALAFKPKKALILAPTFSDYGRALGTVDCKVVRYGLKAENGYMVGSDFLEKIEEDIDMIFLCNPNNPTGELTSGDFIGRILERCRGSGAIVVADECFIDFVDDPSVFSARKYLNAWDSLVILKAFTKLFAMPGIRLGYAMTSSTGIIDRLRASGQDWAVSVIAEAAGMAVLGDREYLPRTRQLVREERCFLRSEIEKLGFKVYGSRANYIFFRAFGMNDLDGRLLRRGILIRSCSNYHGLDGTYYRVAVRTRAENMRLIEEFRNILT
ncbi:MAG: threonine-phosphate decarboxylase [Oligoflexales bacterium]|nr:threonine-phosphate decarboxylase [Oligoflexales bacterium]